MFVFFFAQICYHCDSTSGFIVSLPRHGRFAWWISEMPTLRLPTEGEGGLEYLSPWKTFFCLVWMPRPLQAGQCSAPTLWLSDPWLGARVSGHGGDNETPQNQTNFQSPISPRFRNRPFYPSPRAGIKMTNQIKHSIRRSYDFSLWNYVDISDLPPPPSFFYCLVWLEQLQQQSGTKKPKNEMSPLKPKVYVLGLDAPKS